MSPYTTILYRREEHIVVTGDINQFSKVMLKNVVLNRELSDDKLLFIQLINGIQYSI